MPYITAFTPCRSKFATSNHLSYFRFSSLSSSLQNPFSSIPSLHSLPSNSPNRFASLLNSFFFQIPFLGLGIPSSYLFPPFTIHFEFNSITVFRVGAPSIILVQWRPRPPQPLLAASLFSCRLRLGKNGVLLLNIIIPRETLTMRY